MNNKLVIMMFLILMPLLSGCWDENQPERMLYINGIGVDYKDGKYEVYAQIISFANIAKTEQPITEEAQAEVGFASGKTIDEAIFKLYHSVDQTVYWGHLSYLVVSDELMKNVKLSPVIDLFIRYRETRYQIWVYATTDSVKDVLLVRPVINKALTLSKLSDPENSYKQESYIQPMDIRNLIIGMNEPGHEALIPLITVEENWDSIKEKIKAPVLSGVGVVTPNGFKGFLKGDEADGVQWMNKETARGDVTFEMDDGTNISSVIDKVKVKVDPQVEDDKARFDIEVTVEARVSAIEGELTKEAVEKGVKEGIEKDIKSTYEAALEKDMDIYRLSEYLYRTDVKAWKRIEKEGKVELTEDSIRKLTVKVEKLMSERKSFEQTIENSK